MTTAEPNPELVEVVPLRVRLVARLFWWSLCLMILIAGLAVLGGLFLYNHVTEPGMPLAAVTLMVPEGATGGDVGRLLMEHELIEHPMLLRVAARLDGTGESPVESLRSVLAGRRAPEKNIQHGIYKLYRGYSPTQLLHALYRGPELALTADAYKLTVPEGLTIHQMAALFDDPEAFVAAAHDPELLARLGLDVASLEGFLMPNTYFFDRAPTEREAVERMLQQFLDDWARLTVEHSQARDADMLEIVTLASLIEEEAKVKEERPLVASVLYNRLDKKMPLDMDSTLQYALGKYGQRMLDSDKQVDSPYNTYKNPGLPPGPISNPGLRCIKAALAPADTKYLFFVSNADGTTHTFSETIGEHNAAVARFRTEIREQRRQLEQQAP